MKDAKQREQQKTILLTMLYLQPYSRSLVALAYCDVMTIKTSLCSASLWWQIQNKKLNPNSDQDLEILRDRDPVELETRVLGITFIGVHFPVT